MGLAIAWWIRRQPRFKGTRCAEGVFFFFLMEFLQFIQYFFIADNLADPRCQEIINKVLTVLGFMHICLQVRRLIANVEFFVVVLYDSYTAICINM
jgi:hypothetical protein